MVCKGVLCPQAEARVEMEASLILHTPQGVLNPRQEAVLRPLLYQWAPGPQGVYPMLSRPRQVLGVRLYQ